MLTRNKTFDVVIIGAGASGLMCGISAAKRGRKVLIIDHNEKIGKKILIAGGGKCNFTNYDIDAENYISQNPHFVKSALARFNQWHFLDMINTHEILYEERDHGRLFCQQSSKDILNMLMKDCQVNNVQIMAGTSVINIEKKENFEINIKGGKVLSNSLVIATGGISYQSAGATDFGYQIARQFDLALIKPQPGLVPLHYTRKGQKNWSKLSGISSTCKLTYNSQLFIDELLFTHHGISGPAALQISNYWQKNDFISIDFLPNENVQTLINNSHSKQTLKNFIKTYLPERLIEIIIQNLPNKPIYQYNEKEIDNIASTFHNFKLKLAKKGNFDKAEVTLGGIDTNELSSKTFESTKVKGLYFIGEVLDVTGWLGGYNLQWAWSSGWCAGLFV